jgi:uncharacterized protein YbjT (DUF2867 family)
MANSVLVLGGSGNVGRALAAELASAGESVRAATRKPERLQSADGIRPVPFDYSAADTFGPALHGIDRVFVMAPPGFAQPHKLMLPFLEIAVRGDRKFVVMTASGVEYDDRIPLRQVELYLGRCGRPAVFLRPNWFMDNFHTAWLPSIRSSGSIRVPAGDSRSAFIDSRDVAACAAAALRTSRFDGDAFMLTGPESLTYSEAAAVLSAAAGREIRYEPVDDASFITSLVAAGVPEDHVEYLTGLFAFVRQGMAAAVSAGVQTLTGRPPRTLADYAADHAAAWK